MDHETTVAVAHTFRDISWLIPILPFAAFVLIVMFGKRTPGRGAPIGILAVGAALVIGIGSFLEAIRDTHHVIEKGIHWIDFGPVALELGMRVDTLAAMMFVVVCFVSLLVQIYSTGYMHGEVRYTWYFAALNLFTGSMLTLVIANNTVQMLVGWEGVGICSYLLIGHWHEEKENSDAAIKAFITTKTGDLGFLIGVFVLFIGARTFNIGELQELVGAGELSTTVVTAGALLLFAGAVGKSAQFPLHVWLPDAMAGPTPVSALIHAATMVTAGVYMVARIFGLFSASQDVMNIIAIVASITMLFAAVLAVFQRDIKKVLAYSTVSQLGYMMAGLAVGAATAGVFHLWTHAFFKALLFLGAGSVIHAVHSNNMSDMGGLKKHMPITYRTMLIGALALSGIPPLAGFFSKDEILATFNHAHADTVFWLGAAAAMITAFYTFRMIFLTFHGTYLGHGHPHESPRLMTTPLIILSIAAVAAGWVNIPGVFTGFHHWVEERAVFHPEEAAA